MRTFLLSLALALAAASLPGPTSLPSVGPSYVAALGLGTDLGVDHANKKEKKKKKKSEKKTKVKVDTIEPVKLGKKNVEVHAAVEEKGLTCVLAVSYRDGQGDTPDAVTADDDKNCVIRFDVTKRKEAVGNATAIVTAYDSKGKVVGSKSVTFEVK